MSGRIISCACAFVP